jgi:organic radical activating enzyme
MYRVNEIFYSLQGEGFWTGTPLVFVRLSGCNLQCPFCDTDHFAYTEMSASQIVSEVRSCGGSCTRICLTGGEPCLQADAALLDAFHAAGYTVHMETNGTRPVPSGVDWVTLSPKNQVTGLRGNGTVVLEKADELKLVLAPGVDPSAWAAFPATWHFLQPCDQSGKANIPEVISYIQTHPLWRLSLQTHKLLNIR